MKLQYTKGWAGLPALPNARLTENSEKSSGRCGWSLHLLQLILVLDAELTRHLSTVSETQAVHDGECGEDSASSVQGGGVDGILGADDVSSALGYGALVVVPLYGRAGRAGDLAGEGDSVVCC